MDLLSLIRLFGRHRLVVLLAAALGLGMVVAAYSLAPPAYRASSAVVVFNPPIPPVDPRNPSATVPKAENPYARFGDLSVVVDILKRIMLSGPVDKELRKAGLVGEFTVAANLDFKRGPIVDLATEAPTAELAIESNKILIEELRTQLAKLQSQQGTGETYQIRGELVVPPTAATRVLTSALRRTIAATALAGLLVIGLAVLAEARTERRSKRLGAKRPGPRRPRPVEPTTATAPGSPTAGARLPRVRRAPNSAEPRPPAEGDGPAPQPESEQLVGEGSAPLP